MSERRAGLGKEKVGGGALANPCQWPHVRARRRFAATRPPLLIWIQELERAQQKAQALLLQQQQQEQGMFPLHPHLHQGREAALWSLYPHPGR